MRIDKGQLQKDLKKQLWLVGNDISNLMIRRAAVDTGVLKNSIRFTVQEDGEIIFYMIDYAPHVEYGTKPHGNHPGTTAQPFIRPSLHQLGKILKKRLNGAKITVKV